MQRTKPRTRNKRQRLVEGEDDALDTMVVRRTLVDTPTGPIELNETVPLRMDQPLTILEEDNAAGTSTNTDEVTAGSINEWEGPDGWNDSAGCDTAGLDDTGGPPAATRRDQTFYMREFVSRVDRLLQVHLSKEALLNDTCGKCGKRLGIWRCKECFLPQPLCRSCMRHSHMDHPFHRIERWTGTHFESADLWQVGVYIRLRHIDSSPNCSYLEWQAKELENFELDKDEKDDYKAKVSRDPSHDYRQESNHEEESTDDAAAEIRFMNLMDRMYRGEKDDNDMALEEDDDHGTYDPESDVFYEDIGVGVPRGANDNAPTTDGARSSWPQNATPCYDGLNNKFVRIIHTNGVHHMALANCSCSGENGLPGQLIYSGFMPTSFIRVRTLFTLAVLDQFRYSNLEMKASAYQFFQMLRRITMPMSPTKVVNFYHELRRLSRLWRWMKKLKWAGFGHKEADPMNVSPGELAIFCPACPQPGINLPENWKMDENRWVYRRFFVLDGNFKADHVRQKRAAPDLWLSEGGGMLTRRAEYKEFLRTAINRHTVSRPLLFAYLFL